MARRKRDRSWDNAELIVKAGLAVLVLVSLGIGGVTGFTQTFKDLVILLLMLAIGLGVLAVIAFVGIRVFRATRGHADPVHFQATGESGWRGGIESNPVPAAHWTPATIRAALDEIDWYQFEKFCAALLRADDFAVERKGGAQPDGGVDLVVEKEGATGLIQCKHWKTWVIQERVVRELLGSMTHFKVANGAIYTLKGWTEPAARFAAEHAITLVNGDELAESAALQLKPEQLDDILSTYVHHCPKCESTMVWRTGNFTPFWGCSRYPACRSTLKHSGAR